jgi:hypothetical protein
MLRLTTLAALLLSLVPSSSAIAADEKERRLDFRISMEIPGLSEQPVVAAQCVQSSYIPTGNADLDSDAAMGKGTVVRWLCRTIGGSFAFYFRLDHSDGSETYFLVDADSGEWIRLRKVIDAAESRDVEGDLKAVFRGAMEAHQRDELSLERETGSRIFDTTEIEVVEQARQAFWQELQISDPYLSRRIDWILGTLGGCASPPSPYTQWIVSFLKDLVYGGPPLSPPECTVVPLPLGMSPIDEPIDEEVKKEFGKWAAFPDLPRTD